MNDVKITVMRITTYPDLMERYENPIEHACAYSVGQVFLSREGRKPEGFCDSAWEVISPFAEALAQGGARLLSGEETAKEYHIKKEADRA